MIVFRTGGRLHAGIVGQSLTLFVEYGLFVVGIAVNMQVFPDHIPRVDFFRRVAGSTFSVFRISAGFQEAKFLMIPLFS